MTGLQQSTFRAVLRSHRDGQWYRAASSGQRVTLASLFYAGALERRVWRGTKGDPNAAHEYKVSATASRGLALPELADADARACKTCNRMHAVASEHTADGISDFCSRRCLQTASSGVP